MGSSQSKRWRELQENTFDKTDGYYRREIWKYKCSTENERYNVLLIGQAGAGKSSYINSVMSAITRTDCHLQNTKPKSAASFGTIQFNETNIRNNGVIGNVSFYDTMGMQTDKKGISDDHIKLAAEGKLPSYFKFQRENPEDAKGSQEGHRPHCVIHVVMAHVFNDISDKVQEPMRLQLAKLYHFTPNEIPQFLVITHCDEICDDVKKDVGKIYESQNVLNVVRNSRSVVGIDQQNVFPVVNYFDESFDKITTKQNVPLLNSIYRCIKAAHMRKEFR